MLRSLSFFSLWPWHAACRILVPQPGALSSGSVEPNHWPAREFPDSCFLFLSSIFLLSYKVFALVVKNPPASAGDTKGAASIPGSGRSPGEWSGHWLQCFALEMPGTEEPGRLQSMRSQRVGMVEHTHTHKLFDIFELSFDISHGR